MRRGSCIRRKLQLCCRSLQEGQEAPARFISTSPSPEQQTHILKICLREERSRGPSPSARWVKTHITCSRRYEPRLWSHIWSHLQTQRKTWKPRVTNSPNKFLERRNTVKERARVWLKLQLVGFFFFFSPSQDLQVLFDMVMSYLREANWKALFRVATCKRSFLVSVQAMRVRPAVESRYWRDKPGMFCSYIPRLCACSALTTSVIDIHLHTPQGVLQFLRLK